MYNSYRGRSHTKKQRNNFKQKIGAAERKKRKEQKELARLFPGLQFHWLTKKYKSIFQHSLTKSPLAKQIQSSASLLLQEKVAEGRMRLRGAGGEARPA